MNCIAARNLRHLFIVVAEFRRLLHAFAVYSFLAAGSTYYVYTICVPGLLWHAREKVHNVPA